MILVAHDRHDKIDFLDDNNQIVNGTDCGSAGVMVMLTKWLFEPEALQYQADQRKNSDDLRDEALSKMATNPQDYLPPGAKLLDIPQTLKDIRDANDSK